MNIDLHNDSLNNCKFLKNHRYDVWGQGKNQEVQHITVYCLELTKQVFE